MRKYVVFIGLLIWNTISFAQVPGTWNEYFSFRNIRQLEGVDDNVFALSENGIFIYNTNSTEIQKVTKLNGLSTVGLTCFAFCESTSSFLIGYHDGTLDILEYPSLKVKAIPTIANKSLYGSKKINTIIMRTDTAVIATEFGVLTFSMTTKNFISTTVLSNDGGYIPAKSITTDGNKIYAATTKGIFLANISNPNISDFSSWTKITKIPYENDTISHIAALNGTIYYVHKDIVDASKDSIFKIKDGTAEEFKVQTDEIKNLRVKENILSIISKNGAWFYDKVEKLLFKKNSTGGNNDYSDGIKLLNSYWIGDSNYGVFLDNTITPIVPNGPISNHTYNLAFCDEKLHLVACYLGLWENLFYSVKKDGTWYSHFNWKLNNSICVHPIPQSDTYYIGTYGYGFTKCTHSWVDDTVFNSKNSILKNYYLSGIGPVISDITSDKDGNLWLLNTGTNHPIVALDKNENWYSYYKDWGTGNVETRFNIYNHILIDSKGYKWLTGNEYVSVFYENKTLDDVSDDKFIQIPLTDNEGSIASLSTCLAEDLDGEIWIGTNQGIAVHTAPSRVFKDRQTISRIKIEIDGEVGYLLSSELITCIAVDGANRKWIGTENSGVFLISENGTEQIFNFTKSNSPLPSNTVRSIAIDHQTGEVFIGTDEGLVSYIGDATAGDSEMGNMMVYPNPVRETYEGDIYIKGVVADAIVKITDISGNLVRTVNANGGTAVWDGRNIYGDRVKTGVYLIYISEETGRLTKVTKILFIN